MVIPTPDASSLVDLPNYEKYYTATFTIPTNLIKFSFEVEQVIGCPYNLTKEDEMWFTEHRAELGKLDLDQFEIALFTLDELATSMASRNELTLDAATEAFKSTELSITEAIASVILEYFVEKRFEELGGEPLRPTLKVF